MFSGTIVAYSFEYFIATATITYLLGIGMNAFGPFCQNYCFGITFPIFENITVGTIFSGGLWGAILSGALSLSFRSNFTETSFVWATYPFFFILCMIALLAFNMMEDVNHRQKFEETDDNLTTRVNSKV